MTYNAESRKMCCFEKSKIGKKKTKYFTKCVIHTGKWDIILTSVRPKIIKCFKECANFSDKLKIFIEF